MKKVTCLLMVIVLLIASNSALIMAREEGSYTKEAEALKAVGVFKGTGAGFELMRAPSRVEGGVMFVRLLGGEPEALANHYEHPFADVPGWANDYVGYLWHHQLTTGVSETKFGSSDPMLAKSYATFLLRALGYDDGAGDFSWGQALSKAKEIGLIDSMVLTNLNSTTFLRDHVAKLSYDTLTQSLKNGQQTLAQKLVDQGALDKTVAMTIGVISEETMTPTMDGTNVVHTSSPISVLTETEINEIGAGGFSGSDQAIAEAIRSWQTTHMIYASSSENYPDVSYSMRWNYAFPMMYTTKDMLANMKDGSKYYGICYHYATIYASIAQYYGLEVRITNTTVKPSDVADNPFYTATSKGLSLAEYEVFSQWLTTKGLDGSNYPYEAVRLVMAETALHYRAEVKLDGVWTRFDQYDPVTEGSLVYDFVVTNWDEGYQEAAFADYVTRLKNGEDLRGEGYASAYDEFLEGRLIKIETGEADTFEGITDDAGNKNRASTINEVMEGLGLVPYFNKKEDVLAFYENASWVSEELDELFEIKDQIEAQTGGHFYVICDLMIFGELESIPYDAYYTQYLGFTGEEVPEEVYNAYIK